MSLKHTVVSQSNWGYASVSSHPGGYRCPHKAFVFSAQACTGWRERVLFLSFCGREFQAIITRKLWVLPFFLRCWLVIWIWFHNSQARLVNTILNLKRQFGKVPGYVRWISQLKYSKRWAHLSSSGPSSTAVAGILEASILPSGFVWIKQEAILISAFQGRD